MNVTANPTADWTLQQLREAAGEEGEHRYVIHDRDRIFSRHLDDSIEALGLEVLRSPLASPKANAICERVIGTIRRECLDWMIPLSEGHLKAILRCWVTHYNQRRPHSALGPGVPGPPREVAKAPEVRIPTSIGGGRARSPPSTDCTRTHHEYSLAPSSA